MSRNEVHTKAAPDAVWAVISQPMKYADWVVGTKKVREADATWPMPGSVLYHTSGVGPVEVEDVTIVLDSRERRRIELEARLGSIGTARVTLDLTSIDGGTEIVMEEEFVEGAPSKLRAASDAALETRNIETLRRLADLAESAS